MRRVITGILFPAAVLMFAVFVRANSDDLSWWHPWSAAWDAWLASVVVSSVLIGYGLRAYWHEGGHRQDCLGRPFDHDAVQLDADESAD